jgi:hypothetical protein
MCHLLISPHSLQTECLTMSVYQMLKKVNKTPLTILTIVAAFGLLGVTEG